MPPLNPASPNLRRRPEEEDKAKATAQNLVKTASPNLGAGNAQPTEKATPLADLPAKAPAEAPAATRAAPAAKVQGVPDFKDNPVGALGFLFQSIGAGITGGESPLDAVHRRNIQNSQNRIAMAQMQINALAQIGQTLPSIPKDQRATFLNEQISQYPAEVQETLRAGANRLVMATDQAGVDIADITGFAGLYPQAATMMMNSTLTDKQAFAQMKDPEYIKFSQQMADFVNIPSIQSKLQILNQTINSNTGRQVMDNLGPELQQHFATTNGTTPEGLPIVTENDMNGLGAMLNASGVQNAVFTQTELGTLAREPALVAQSLGMAYRSAEDVSTIRKEARALGREEEKGLTGHAKALRDVEIAEEAGDTEKAAALTERLELEEAKLISQANTKGQRIEIGPDGEVTIEPVFEGTLPASSVLKLKGTIAEAETAISSYVLLADALKRNPGGATMTGEVAQVFGNVSASIGALLDQPGAVKQRQAQPDDTGANWLDLESARAQADSLLPEGLSSATAEFKSLLITSAFVTASALFGQTARGLSDKDFERALQVLTGGSTEAANIIPNILNSATLLDKRTRSQIRGAEGQLGVDPNSDFLGLSQLGIGATQPAPKTDKKTKEKKSGIVEFNDDDLKKD